MGLIKFSDSNVNSNISSISNRHMQNHLPLFLPDGDMRATSIVSARLPTLRAPSPVYRILSSAASRLSWSSRYYPRNPSSSSPISMPCRKTTAEPIAHRLPDRRIFFQALTKRDIINFRNLHNIFTGNANI